MSPADQESLLQAIEVQRRELFAITAVAACLARSIDDEFAPAAELIGRVADGVADALAAVGGREAR